MRQICSAIRVLTSAGREMHGKHPMRFSELSSRRAVVNRDASRTGRSNRRNPRLVTLPCAEHPIIRRIPIEIP